MNDDIRNLIESIRKGDYSEMDNKIDLLSALLSEKDAADANFLLGLLKAPHVPLRMAAILACRQRSEPELLDFLAFMVEDADARVRMSLAKILPNLPAPRFLPLLRKLMDDPGSGVRIEAIKASSGIASFVEAQCRALERDSHYGVRMAAVEVLGSQSRGSVARSLFLSLANDAEDEVQRKCAEALEQRLTDSPATIEPQLPTEIILLEKAAKALKDLGADRFAHLEDWINSRTMVEVSPEALARFGTNLSVQASNGDLPRAHCVEQMCAGLIEMLQRPERRSIVLIGEAGCGKTAIIQELVHQLRQAAHGGWQILRISPTDFMTDTKYIGEWETKLRDLIQTVRKPRRVLIYVPHLENLTAVGTTSKSDSNVATALAPYLEDGSVLLIGESTPAEYERGFGNVPALRRLFDKVLIKETTVSETRAILSAVRDDSSLQISDEILDQCLELSGQFLSNAVRPGNAVAFLRDVIAGHEDATQAVTFLELLQSLSKSTGIPKQLLDDTAALNIGEVTEFFERRVMGQPEAVQAMVDLATLIKAGLTDPNKPMGIFLFVGPTGVGKTELARALAEFIFGDAGRLLRFDMSEFSTHDGFERLIGVGNQRGIMTDAIRQQPFSVVLLDEIEKSHLNVFDLCLQIFDAGRLTDGHGKTVNCRRSVFILTSNIGATSAVSSPVGFNAQTQAPGTDSDRTLRELSRFFRPEFLNRIDRILNFRPLSLEVAESIARREVEIVLRRTGIAQRKLIVDVDASAIALLVREGYSAHFGARPLKRAVERLMVLPLARIIASGQTPRETVVRLVAKDNRLEAILPPRPKTKVVSAPREVTTPFESRIQSLVQSLDELKDHVRVLADKKSVLLERTANREFYRDAVQRTQTFDEIHKLDQFLAAHEKFGKALEGLRARISERAVSKLQENSVRERLDEMTLELDQIRLVSTSRDGRDLADAIVGVSLVDRAGSSQKGVESIVAMYEGLARRRRITCEIAAEFLSVKEDNVYLQMSGLGAYALLKGESGLHQLDRRYRTHAARSGKEKQRDDREMIRVDVFALLTEPPKSFKGELETKITAVKAQPGRFIRKPAWDISLFHRPSVRSLRAGLGGSRAEAVARMEQILYAQLGTQLPDHSTQSIVRYYEVGIDPRVKDVRTGRTSTRVDRILAGQIDLFLTSVEGA